MEWWQKIPVLSSAIKSRVINQGRNRPVVQLSLPENEAVTPIVPLMIPWSKYYLNVPPNSAAVVTSPDGRQFLVTTGGYLDIEQGSYGVQFVDMSQRMTQLHNVMACSSDAWNVTLDVNIIWQVRNPLQLANISHPIHTLIDLCRAATVNFIQTQTHDRLVPASDVVAMSESEIANGILERLANNPALAGFRFININIPKRQGDPQRMEKIQQSMVKQTEAQRDLRVQIEKLKSELEVSQQKFTVAEQQEHLAIQEARVNRMRIEEESKVAITQAELQKKVSEIMYSVQHQTVEIQQMSAAQQLQQEQFLKTLEVSRDALTQFASVVMQAQMTPGLAQAVDPSVFEVFARAMEALSRAAPILNVPPSQPDASQDILSPVNVKNLKD
jgi:hypothetical protein